MTKPDLAPMDLALRGLLDVERTRAGAPARTKVRAYGRLMSAVAVATTAAAAGKTASAAAPAGKVVAVAATTKVAIALVVGVVLGSAATASFVATSTRPPVATGSTTATAPPASVRASPTVTTPPPVETTPTPSPSPSPRPSPRSAEPKPAPPQSLGTSVQTEPIGRSLGDERRVLDRARAALTHKDAELAIATAREHEAAFPHGQLAAEREAVLVQGLAMANRRAEAIERAARFLRHSHLRSQAGILPAARAASTRLVQGRDHRRRHESFDRMRDGHVRSQAVKASSR